MKPYTIVKREIAAALPHATVKTRRDTYHEPEPTTVHTVTVEHIDQHEFWTVAAPIADRYRVRIQHITPLPPRTRSRRRVWTRNQ